jgi:nitroreductase
VPSLSLVSGGALLWFLVGDAGRVARKYGERADRFLLLEAGHSMQNLCLLSVSLGLVTLPLGGVLERKVAHALRLTAHDLVLYAGVCGRPGSEPAREMGVTGLSSRMVPRSPDATKRELLNFSLNSVPALRVDVITRI